MKDLPVTLLEPEDSLLQECYPVFHALRPHLDPVQFADCVRAQYREGYRIVFLRTKGVIAAAAGYRIAHFLAWGKTLYLDDLCTLPGMTGSGLGGKLMDWLIEEAEAQRCSEIHLDTGFQRHAAHRLYLRKGMQLSCHHLSRVLPGPGAGK
jgi:GNAT superfamily N-acetyltransferase